MSIEDKKMEKRGESVRTSIRGLLVLATAAASFVSIQCNDLSFSTVLDGPEGALVIRPQSKVLRADEEVTFTARGGIPPYRFTVAGKGLIDGSTGRYTAPDADTVDVVIVTDSYDNTANAEVAVLPRDDLDVAPPTITVLVGGSVSYTATGGTPPYAYSVTHGGGTIDADTGLYTAPDQAGSTTVEVRDSRDRRATATITIVRPLAINPLAASLLAGSEFSFEGQGGVPPREFTVHSGGGTIDGSTGLYTAPSTDGTVTIRVTDALGTFSESEVIVSIPDALSVNPYSVTVASGGSLQFAGSGGVPPYSFALASSSAFTTGSVDASTGRYTAGTAGAAVTHGTTSNWAPRPDKLCNTSHSFGLCRGPVDRSNALPAARLVENRHRPMVSL